MIIRGIQNFLSYLYLLLKLHNRQRIDKHKYEKKQIHIVNAYSCFFGKIHKKTNKSAVCVYDILWQFFGKKYVK